MVRVQIVSAGSDLSGRYAPMVHKSIHPHLIQFNRSDTHLSQEPVLVDTLRESM